MVFDLNLVQKLEPCQYFGFVIMIISGIFLSHLPISFITKSLYLLHDRKDISLERADSYITTFSHFQSTILGMSERALFITSFFINAPEFIALYFGLKMVVRWKRWDDEDGRLLFNNFLVGNILSIIFSYFSFFFFLTFFIDDEIQRRVFMIVSILLPYLLSLFFYCCIEKFNVENRYKAKDFLK
jgi:hypothetical protein